LEPRDLLAVLRRLRLRPSRKPPRAGPRDLSQRRGGQQDAAAVNKTLHRCRYHHAHFTSLDSSFSRKLSSISRAAFGLASLLFSLCLCWHLHRPCTSEPPVPEDSAATDYDAGWRGSVSTGCWLRVTTLGGHIGGVAFLSALFPRKGFTMGGLRAGRGAWEFLACRKRGPNDVGHVGVGSRRSFSLFVASYYRLTLEGGLSIYDKGRGHLSKTCVAVALRL
jgi:hypothetical protein